MVPKLRESAELRCAFEYDLVHDLLGMVVPSMSKAEKQRALTIPGSAMALFDAIFGLFRERYQALVGSGEFDSVVSVLFQPHSYRIVEGPPRTVEFDRGALATFHRMADASLGRSFASELAETVLDAIATIYVSARESAAAQVSAPVGRLPVNQHAIETLKKQSLFWIGEAYHDTIRFTVNDAIADVVKLGLSPREGRDVLKRELGGVFDRTDAYWYVVAHAAMGRASNYGAISRYYEAEIESYEWVSVIDETTTCVCRYLDGRVFNVAPAKAIMDSVLRAERPEHVRTARPWVRFDKRRALAGKDALWTRTTKDGRAPHDPSDDLAMREYLPDSDFELQGGVFVPRGKPGDKAVNVTLEQLGRILPPIHGRCRSDTVVSRQSIDDYLRGGK